jgi:hypothetical protein
VAGAQVPPAADGLGDRAVGEIGADRHHGAVAADQQQQRRHQRPATDPGESDEDADPEAEEDDQRVHDRGSG